VCCRPGINTHRLARKCRFLSSISNQKSSAIHILDFHGYFKHLSFSHTLRPLSTLPSLLHCRHPLVAPSSVASKSCYLGRFPFQVQPYGKTPADHWHCADQIEMCYYDTIIFSCNCWKWSHFRQHCSQEYRTGETCGLHLCMNPNYQADKCKICKKIETKTRSIAKEDDRIKRWRKEGGKTHSIAKSQEEIAHLEKEIQRLYSEKDQKLRTLW
jgi:hypothetical protein